MIQINEFDEIFNVFTNPEIPNVCPICSHIINPDVLLISHTRMDEKTHIRYSECVYKCPNHTCNSLFICKYEEFGTHSEIYETLPKTLLKIEVSDGIKRISPSFIQIYEQANRAYSMSLNEICGVGYRKAIEFLVKDYLKSIENVKYSYEQIERTSLRNCINQWIEDPRIKGLLTRTTILGNDETHYVRRYGEQDIILLQQLIKLVLHFIDMELEVRKIEQDFPI